MNEFTLHVWMAIAYIFRSTIFLTSILHIAALKPPGVFTVSHCVYFQPTLSPLHLQGEWAKTH